MRPIRFSNSDRACTRSLIGERRRPRNVSLVFLKFARFFLSFFLSWLLSLLAREPSKHRDTLCSARDQSRKIKDSSESPTIARRNRVFRERTAPRGSRSRKRIETNECTNEWGQREEGSRGIHDSSPFSGFDLDFPLCHPSLYHACDLCLLRGGGGGNRTPARLENRSNARWGGRSQNVLSYENISQLEASPLCVTYSSSNARFLVYALHTVQCINVHPFLRVSRGVATPLTHTWQQHESTLRYLYPVAEISSLKTVRFFSFFFFCFSRITFWRKRSTTGSLGMDDPRNINLSTNLLFSKRSIYTSLRVYRRLRSKYFRTIFQILGNSFPNIYTSILFFATRFNTGVGTVRCTFVLG